MNDQLAGIHLVAGRRVPAPQARRAGPATRVLARIRADSLDTALSEGADPASSGLLAQRAAWVTDRRSRRSLARSLRRTLDTLEPRRARPALTSAVPPNRAELESASQPLTRIAEMLESSEPVYAQGVARLHLLLARGGSALYDPDHVGQLAPEVEEILSALEGREETW